MWLELPASFEDENSVTLAVQHNVENLIHASKCKEGTCEFTHCAEIKQTMRHQKSCNSIACEICELLPFFIFVHANNCEDCKCPVPFCLQFKVVFVEQKIKHSLPGEIAKFAATIRLPNIENSKTVNLSQSYIMKNFSPIVQTNMMISATDTTVSVLERAQQVQTTIIKHATSIMMTSLTLYYDQDNLGVNPFVYANLVARLQYFKCMVKRVSLMKENTSLKEEIDVLKIKKGMKEEFGLNTKILNAVTLQMWLELPAPYGDKSVPLAIKSNVENLIHASKCEEKLCDFLRCAEIKKEMEHQKSCNHVVCESCGLLLFFAFVHAKDCQDRECPVPYCQQSRIEFLERDVKKLLPDQISKFSGTVPSTNIGSSSASSLSQSSQSIRSTLIPENISSGVSERSWQEQAAVSNQAYSLMIAGLTVHYDKSSLGLNPIIYAGLVAKLQFFKWQTDIKRLEKENASFREQVNVLEERKEDWRKEMPA